ncbi:molybdopterin-dependent oxidoreductase [uncultured Mucilaginibacter sp.]|uniref:molybdopterin-dependent oxidoreductase n=1 Tax=uncultured Mucilaginibacter sp. TaxID=797541 RepID=UPI0025F20511|nr:molybdopterin-dependent oxidoreductase [uncultured Mucilaginibacter sp.]
MEEPINDPGQTPKPNDTSPNHKIEELDAEALLDKQIKRRRFIAFGSFIVLQAAAFGGWKWLANSPEEVKTVTAGAKAPLRRALNQTELFCRRLFSGNHLVKTYPKEMVPKNLRSNSYVGMPDNFNPANWKMQVVKSPTETLTLTIDDIKALPKTELIYDFKCVEGWDQIQHWAGVKFSDFVAHYKLDKQAAMEYVGFATEDKQYYVGIDMPSALHPQTLLAYEVNDGPIPIQNGAPLRLIIPVKYGIKNLKRIATISFSNQRPPDYWAEQGYDYYSGL